MPEGPSILIAKEAIRPLLKGKTILAVEGNSKIDFDRLINVKIKDVRTWGKHLLICFKGFTLRIHFLMFGSYSIDINEKLPRSLRMSITTASHTIYFFTCAIREIEGDLDSHYDWKADVLSDEWSAAAARKKLKALPRTMVCDALLNQDIFAGVGNIIKNEVLYRIKLHPESIVSKIPPRKLSELIRQAREYSFDFLEWKKAYVLRKHWLAHTKRTCLRCDLPLIKKYCGKTKRRTFFCKNCQVKY
jgi:endonuclease-8